jgi:hypothetical protein
MKQIQITKKSRKHVLATPDLRTPGGRELPF